MTTAGGKGGAAPTAGGRRRRVADFLGLERNVVIVSAAALLLGFGEELWKFEPRAPFVVAGLIGLVVTVVFAATVDERHAG